MIRSLACSYTFIARRAAALSGSSSEQMCVEAEPGPLVDDLGAGTAARIGDLPDLRG